MNKSIYKSEEGKMIILKVYEDILNKAPVKLKEHMIKTSQGTTCVYTCGQVDLPPLFLIHGSGSNSFCWLGDLEFYSKHYHVYMIDVIGEANFSEENRPSYKTSAYAMWLHDIQEHFNLNTISIIGLSLGGWIGMNYAIAFPDKVDYITMISSGGFASTKASFYFKLLFYVMFSKKEDEKISRLLNGGKLPDLNEEGLKKALAFTNLIQDHMTLRNEPLPLFKAIDLNRVTSKVLAIYGEKDALLRPEKSIQHLQTNLKYFNGIVLEDVGHIVTGVQESILGFLQGENNENIYK